MIRRNTNYFIKCVVAWGIGLLVITSFYQCHTTERSQTVKNETVEETGLLWSITHDGSLDTSYLFGTIHMIPAEQFFLPAGTENALLSVARVLFEVDLNLMNDPAEQMAMLQKAMMKGNLSLADLLSAEDYALVKDHFKGMGIPLFLLERLKPIFLSVFADETIFSSAEGQQSMKFYEMEFLDMANQAGKEIGGLESIDFQLSVMDSIPYEEQAQILVESIKAENEGNSEMDGLVQLYTEQRIGDLLSSFASDSLSRYDSILLIKRNENWIPVMEENMEHGSCFFAVGAAHLPGSSGVIHLLRKKGYTLKPVL